MSLKGSFMIFPVIRGRVIIMGRTDVGMQRWIFPLLTFRVPFQASQVVFMVEKTPPAQCMRHKI